MDDGIELQVDQLHAEAKAALEFDVRAFRPKSRLRLLEAMKGEVSRRCEYYEAYIMTAVIGRIRPLESI